MFWFFFKCTVVLIRKYASSDAHDWCHQLGLYLWRRLRGSNFHFSPHACLVTSKKMAGNFVCNNLQHPFTQVIPDPVVQGWPNSLTGMGRLLLLARGLASIYFPKSPLAVNKGISLAFTPECILPFQEVTGKPGSSAAFLCLGSRMASQALWGRG